MFDNRPIHEEVKAQILMKRGIHVEIWIFEHHILKKGKEMLDKLPE
jgi:hypothetical protein